MAFFNVVQKDIVDNQCKAIDKCKDKLKHAHMIAKQMHVKLGDSNQYEIKHDEKKNYAMTKRKKRNLKKIISLQVYAWPFIVSLRKIFLIINAKT